MQTSFEMKASAKRMRLRARREVCLSLHIKKPSDQYLIQHEEWREEENPLKKKSK